LIGYIPIISVYAKQDIYALKLTIDDLVDISIFKYLHVQKITNEVKKINNAILNIKLIFKK